jgi:hypothetical protein
MKEGTMNRRTKAAEAMRIELVDVQSRCEESGGPHEEVHAVLTSRDLSFS